ncbi:hypothetical protein LFM09_25630 [Lentzea alba]|uniref:hypothetical protein n=1 Tax=Lentzea alba TaxID=2714351 RepID=UPI0039BEE176
MLIDIVIAAAWGLALLVTLWPMAQNGVRLLKRWEIADPTEAQVEEAVRYLKRRRLLYPWIYAGLALAPPWTDGIGQLVVVVLGGSLLAELLALRPRRDALRVATLTPRGLFDIASKWVLGSYTVLVVGGAIYLGMSQQWDRFLWLVLSVVATVVIIWAAVARPATGDQAVDMALRTRSVHVSAGLGVALAGVLIGHSIGFVGILAWISMANTKPVPAKIKG